MSDNGLPGEGLFAPVEKTPVTERREFFKRAAAIGLPVALATVRANTAWGQEPDPTGSCAMSLGSSGCAARRGIMPAI
jgi:hypothetical protein